MSDYIVSARKYRPQTFDTVIGQEALVKTLKNAIVSNHLAHAYLFCGPRGVGKTTCARIFAKTINCEHRLENGEACDQCESCKAFNNGDSFNIHELDAASNNSVDDIRSLTENVRMLPQVGKYSVYIVDEVHMLTSQAFNAFLKTLEEPPAHAIFILATTEKHKILPTILSRCQIYDFNRIRITDTVNHLRNVAQNEGIEAEDEALNVIAQKADGAMRDALSIFDQVTSFCGNHITYQETIKSLNVLDYDYYFKITDALRSHNVSEALMLFDTILNKGFEGQHFVTGLASHFRDVLVSKDTVTLSLLEVGENAIEKYKTQAASTDTRWLYKAIEIATDCDINYKISRNKRLHVEAALIRLANIGMEEASKKAKSELPIVTKPAVAPTPTAEPIQPATAVKAKPIVTTTTAPIQPVAITKRKAPSIFGGTKSNNSTPQTTEENRQQTKAEDNAAQQTKRLEFDKLWNVWKNFANSLKEDDFARNSMLNYPPKVTGDASLSITLVNDVQLSLIRKYDTQLKQVISSAFGIDGVSLDYKIGHNEDLNELHIMSNEEKMKKIMEKSPVFQLLQTEIGLELI
ncbi:MAG: DNA polymerase III subunit gamma/tau [Paludibacteraceae bacterium]|nr:DNA polymerase III subunit gamma/tau [Paludibacteraceae bacterium]